MELTALKQLYANRRREFIWLDLQGQDLTAWELPDIILRESNLESVILTRANLRNARFPKSNLNGANLQFADLVGAKFVKASLVGADLRGANLTDVDFRYADLTSACLDLANLTNANFIGANLTGVDWGNADVSGAIFEPKQVQVESEPNTANTMIQFQDKWNYRPEDLLTTPQKLALSPLIWLCFIFSSYFYQGFFASNFLKHGYSFAFSVLSGISPLLWLLASDWYWLFPAVITAIILVLTFDWFSFLFTAIAMFVSLARVKKYRAVLDRVHLHTFGEVPKKLQKSVLKDALVLSLFALSLVSLFRVLFVQPGFVFYWLSALILAISGGIIIDLRPDQVQRSHILFLLLGISWLGLVCGLGWRYTPNMN
ncbi:MAG: pentapeptide repeat-containing protein [Pseudanabaenaceae cyanobacterium]